MLKINIVDETSELKSVVLGIADSFGGTPQLEEAYDPKSRENIINGTFPVEVQLKEEVEGVAKVLERYGVKVYRPSVIEHCNQIFSRDIGFVIDDKFIRPRILKNRMKEISGIDAIVAQINPEQVIHAPKGTRMEGGDVMPWKEFLFVGYSEKEDFEKYIVSRTNRESVDFLQANFPNREVKAFELKKSDTDPKENALHLDCCFQPIGKDHAIIYKGGFKHESDYEFLVNYFGKDKIIEITKEEMYQMNSNVFSINPEVIISEVGFVRVNAELEKRGLTIEKVKYSEVAKMEGLFRCSTLPLLRV